MEAESRAVASRLNIFSTNEQPIHRYPDASENATKARAFLTSLLRAGTVVGIVEFVASASRFKLFLPVQGCRLALTLAGIRTPRPGRNEREKGDLFGTEALKYSQNLVNQREVEITFISSDKVGVFLGTLSFQNNGKPDDLSVLLVKEGYASLMQSTIPSFLSKALNKADQYSTEKNLKLKACLVISEIANISIKPDVSRECVVSEIARSNSEFYIQFVDPDLSLSKLMERFAEFHSKGEAAYTISPCKGQFVSARFTADETWYCINNQGIGHVLPMFYPITYSLLYTLTMEIPKAFLFRE